MNYNCTSDGITTIGTRAVDSEKICLTELEDGQKRLDRLFYTLSQNREAREIKLQQQISEFSDGWKDKMEVISEKMEHIANTLANMQLQLLNDNNEKLRLDEESISDAREELNIKSQQISEPILGQIEKGILDIVVDLKINWTSFDDSIDLEGAIAQTPEINAIPGEIDAVSNILQGCVESLDIAKKSTRSGVKKWALTHGTSHVMLPQMVEIFEKQLKVETRMKAEVSVLLPSSEFIGDEYWPPPMISPFFPYGFPCLCLAYHDDPSIDVVNKDKKIHKRVSSTIGIGSMKSFVVVKYNPDLTLLLASNIIISTSEKWDSMSRNWHALFYAKDVGIIILGKIHGADHCCIGTPIYFTDLQWIVVSYIATIVGLHLVRLIHETTTTALAYEIYKAGLPENEAMNVFCFDVCNAIVLACIDAFKKRHLKGMSHGVGGSKMETELGKYRLMKQSKNMRKNEASDVRYVNHDSGAMIPDLGSVLMKHSSKKDAGNGSGLDKYLVIRLTRYEREVQEVTQNFMLKGLREKLQSISKYELICFNSQASRTRLAQGGTNHNIVSWKHCFFSTTSQNELSFDLVMEYVRESMYNIQKHYSGNRKMSLIYMTLYTYQIYSGVDCMHSIVGVCHIGFKPQNVLVNLVIQLVKIGYFGIAKVLTRDEKKGKFAHWIRDLPCLLEEVDSVQKGINTLLSLEETYADINPVHISKNPKGAFILVMRGCNNMCSVCIVLFTKGREILFLDIFMVQQFYGTQNKGVWCKQKLGVNVILAVSLVFCKVGVVVLHIHWCKHIANLANDEKLVLPVPSYNVIDDGPYTGNNLPMQVFMVFPVRASFCKEAMKIGVEVYPHLKAVINKKYGRDASNVGRILVLDTWGQGSQKRASIIMNMKYEKWMICYILKGLAHFIYSGL